MILHVKEAKYSHDYVIWIKFNDGIEGEIDLKKELISMFEIPNPQFLLIFT